MTHRLGQKLINYVRFLKDKPENFPPSPCECYIFNMTDAEFIEALNISNEEFYNRVPKKYRNE